MLNKKTLYGSIFLFLLWHFLDTKINYLVTHHNDQMERHDTPLVYETEPQEERKFRGQNKPAPKKRAPEKEKENDQDKSSDIKIAEDEIQAYNILKPFLDTFGESDENGSSSEINFYYIVL